MEKIRKYAVIFGLILFIAVMITTVFDPYSDIPLIKEFTKKETLINFPLNYFSTVYFILAIIELISIFLFYFFSWKGNKKAIVFLIGSYIFELLLLTIEWKPSVNLEVTNFLTNLCCLTDGIILCTFMMQSDPIEKNNEI